MNPTRKRTRWFATVLASGLVFSVGYLIFTGGSRWWRHHDSAEFTDREPGEVVVEAMLTEGEATRLRDLVRRMVNPSQATEAAAELRDHFDRLARERPDGGAPSMAFFLQCLAPRFASLDTQTRQLSLAMLSDIFGWFGEHENPCWTALLGSSGTILGSALSDTSTDVTLAGLQMIRACWDWAPPAVSDTGHRKALGTWKAELHSRCVELMRCPNEKVRASAAVAVVSVPIDSAAARGLILLHDDSAAVRRATLLALSERQELLANEDVVGFLRDPSAAVRTSAEMVLTSRGLTAEQVALAKRATDPSPLVRAQAPRHILESSAVDRIVWLGQLSRDVAATVRAEAARALASVGNEECIDRLGQMADSDPDPQVRHLANSLCGGRMPNTRRLSDDAGDEKPQTLPTLRTPKTN